MKPTVMFTLLLAIVVATGMGRYRDSLSDGDLVKYATPFHGSQDWASFPKDGTVIGTHKGTKLVATVRCSDVCPGNTRMVIHYEAKPGAECKAAGGREVQVLMPIAIAVRNEAFCVPEALESGKLYTAP
jgi:hypothetical protein